MAQRAAVLSDIPMDPPLQLSFLVARNLVLTDEERFQKVHVDVKEVYIIR